MNPGEATRLYQAALEHQRSLYREGREPDLAAVDLYDEALAIAREVRLAHEVMTAAWCEHAAGPE